MSNNGLFKIHITFDINQGLYIGAKSSALISVWKRSKHKLLLNT